MSNIYIQEPPTKGKVLLETTVGDIEIELWSRECPKTCRNFVQLCMENYYNKTKFHRVVKNFIVQGGDPTGTGSGGESVYGRPFKDEFHSRLRFVRRGLVAMANAGRDDNGSQFFFTFGPTQELQNKHTIFGKVVGDTIYNMLKLGEGLVNDESPENPNKILRSKVLNNPFPDIKPRQLIQMIHEEKKGKRPKSKMKATKDFSLLSFGDEAEEEEEDLIAASKDFSAPVSGGKSSHDLLNDPKLSSKVGIKQKVDDGKDDEMKDVETNLETVKKKLKRSNKVSSETFSKQLTTVDEDQEDFKIQICSDEDEETREKKKRREDILKEIKSLKKEMKKPKSDPKQNEEKDSKDQVEITEEEAKNDMLLEFHQEQKKRSKSKAKGSERENMTMKLLEKFKTKLHSVKEQSDQQVAGEEDSEEISGDKWMANTLKFESNDPILAKDANSKDDDWFDIYDPRNPINRRRRGEKRKSKH